MTDGTGTDGLAILRELLAHHGLDPELAERPWAVWLELTGAQMAEPGSLEAELSDITIEASVAASATRRQERAEALAWQPPAVIAEALEAIDGERMASDLQMRMFASGVLLGFDAARINAEESSGP